MSFTMENIKRKAPNKQEIIKDCYRQLYQDELLTDNLKCAIWKYCNFRFKARSAGKFNYDILYKMIIELLEKICHKKIFDITQQDLYLAEYEGLYQIKRAIFFGSLKSLYYEKADEDLLDKLNTTEVDFKITTSGARLSEYDVENYFKDVMV